MGLSYFMRERTELIRLFYGKGRPLFEQMQWPPSAGYSKRARRASAR